MESSVYAWKAFGVNWWQEVRETRRELPQSPMVEDYFDSQYHQKVRALE